MTLRSYTDWSNDHVLSSTASVGDLDIGAFSSLLPIINNAAQSPSLRRVLIGAIVGWFIFMFFFVFPSVDSIAVILPLFCLGPAILVAFIVGGWHLLMSSLFDTPELLLSGVLLRRGDEVELEYHQHIKRAITFKSLTFNLILRETATYDQGTNTVTEHHDQVIWTDSLLEVVASPEQGIDHKMKIKIPNNAMHTFNAPRNSLTWMLNVAIDVPNFPDYHQSYPLMVLPQVNDES